MLLTRREFLRICVSTGASMALTQVLGPNLAQAFAELPGGKPPVFWLDIGSCSGDSLSFFNVQYPDYSRFIEEIVDERFHYLPMAAEGGDAMRLYQETLEQQKGRYILVVEGAITTRDGGIWQTTGNINGRPLTALEAFQALAENAKDVVAAGSCATWGGPSAAHPNPGQYKRAQELTSKRVINVPGCPTHPDWLMGTLLHLVFYGRPQLDSLGRPTLYFGQTIHDRCPRRQYFENGIFAKQPGDEGCLYSIGCKGPVTYSDCPIRQWNTHYNWPVEANTPCIGCVNPGFPDSSEPYFVHLPSVKIGGVTVAANTVGLVTGAVTASVIGTHAIATIVSGRLKHNLLGEPAGEQSSEASERPRRGGHSHRPGGRVSRPKHSLWKRLFGGRNRRGEGKEGDEQAEHE